MTAAPSAGPPPDPLPAHAEPGEPTLLFETVHGSRAYGLHTVDSDWDFKGVVVGPRAWYLGFVGGPEQVELGPDHVRYELRKFMRLAAGGNPTLLEVLFTDPEDHRVCHPAMAPLLEQRQRFVSQKVGPAFGGYALSQLKHIETHRRWLFDPPLAAPDRRDYGLPERAVAPPDQIGAAEAMLQKGELAEADVSANFLALLDAERRYRAARQTWQQFQHWQKTRNPKRAALEARFGYDTKHAMHLIRLLTMGAEILETGVVQVRRPDRDDLLAIRGGALSYEALRAHAEALEARMRVAQATTTLPAAPDLAALDALCGAIIADLIGVG